MAKKLNDWLDEFVENGANPKDVTDWPEEAGQGIIEVNELPELGKEGAVYKLPNNTYWTCENTTEEKVISDLAVGKTFKFVDKILITDAQAITEKLSSEYPYYFEETPFPALAIWHGQILYIVSVGETQQKLEYTQSLTEVTYLVAELSNLETIPSVEITQTFNDAIEENNGSLEDLCLLFENGSHIEEVEVSTWTQLGGGSTTSTSFVQVNYGDKIVIHCDAIKELLVENGVDISASAIGDVYFHLMGCIYNGYSPQGISNIRLHPEVFSSGSLHDYYVSLEGDYSCIRNQRIELSNTNEPTLDSMLTECGDINIDIQDSGYVVFFINLSIGNVSSGYWIELTQEDINNCFTVIPANQNANA